jgi:hypothetical protein
MPSPTCHSCLNISGVATASPRLAIDSDLSQVAPCQSPTRPFPHISEAPLVLPTPQFQCSRNPQPPICSTCSRQPRRAGVASPPLNHPHLIDATPPTTATSTLWAAEALMSVARARESSSTVFLTLFWFRQGPSEFARTKHDRTDRRTYRTGRQ